MARRLTSPAAAPAPTIRDVANAAGVGVSTVSRVLNDGSVSPEAREKVKLAIEELGFAPMPTARGLATRQSATVGLVVNSTRGSWFSELLAGVEHALLGSRRSLLLASLRLTGEYDASAVEAWIQERRVDGVLFVRSSRRERALLQAARQAGLPIGLITPDECAQAQVTVSCDNERAGELVANHLVDLGHERLAFVGGPRGSRDTRDRVRGFQRALERRGLRLPDERLTFAESYYAEAAYGEAHRFVRLPSQSRPTAVVLASDALALGFSKVLLDHGVNIPGQVSVAGFDGTPEGELSWPGLTTVAQPTRTMAESACETLLRCIESNAPQPGRTRRFEVELLSRRSCAPPPGR